MSEWNIVYLLINMIRDLIINKGNSAESTTTTDGNSGGDGGGTVENED